MLGYMQIKQIVNKAGLINAKPTVAYMMSYTEQFLGVWAK